MLKSNFKIWLVSKLHQDRDQLTRYWIKESLEDVGGSLFVGWKSDDDHFFVVLFHYPFVKTAFGKNVRKREKLYLIINFSKAYLINHHSNHLQ